MLKIEKILVPVDFSERSIAAAEHAVSLSKRFHSKLIFVHVIPPAPYEHAAFEGGLPIASMTPWEEQAEDFFEKRLNELVEKTAKDSGAEKLLLKGEPAKKIAELVPAQNIDLIVMPTHGYGPFRRFVLGSVTTKILHDVSCAVFTGAHVPEVAPFNQEPYKRIACAIDLKDHSEAVLRWAWDFAKAWTEDLVVIHAAPQIEAGGSYGEWYPPDTRELLIKAANEKVVKLIEKVGCKAEVHLESADPVRYIPEAVEAAYADVLIIGRSPETGLLGRLRTHAHALIREARCPVISV